MRYLVLLFVAAFMMLNEPSKPIVDSGQSAVDDQIANSTVTPATPPTAANVLATNPTAANIDLAYAQPPTLAVNLEGLQRIWYNSTSSTINAALNFNQPQILALTQEGSRCLCFGLTSYYQSCSSSTTVHTATSRRSQEAVPRYLL